MRKHDPFFRLLSQHFSMGLPQIPSSDLLKSKSNAIRRGPQDPSILEHFPLETLHVPSIRLAFRGKKRGLSAWLGRAALLPSPRALLFSKAKRSKKIASVTSTHHRKISHGDRSRHTDIKKGTLCVPFFKCKSEKRNSLRLTPHRLRRPRPPNGQGDRE